MGQKSLYLKTDPPVLLRFRTQKSFVFMFFPFNFDQFLDKTWKKTKKKVGKTFSPNITRTCPNTATSKTHLKSQIVAADIKKNRL